MLLTLNAPSANELTAAIIKVSGFLTRIRPPSKLVTPSSPSGFKRKSETKKCK